MERLEKWKEETGFDKNWYRCHRYNTDPEYKERIKKYNKTNYPNRKEWYEQYYQNNIERLKQYSKNWRETNKEKRKEYRKKYYLRTGK